MLKIESIDWKKIRELVAKNTQTDKGKEKALKILPYKDRKTAEKEIKWITELKYLLKTKNLTPFPDKEIKEIFENVKKYLLIRPEEAVKILSFLEHVEKLKNNLKDKNLEIHEFIKNFDPLPHLQNELKNTFTKDGKIDRRKNKRLWELEIEIAEIKAKLEKEAEKLINKYRKYLQDEFWTLRNNRFVIPVKLGAQGEVKGIIHDVSNSEKTVFLEPLEILSLNNELQEKEIEKKAEEEKILKKITNLLRENINTLERNLELMIEFDLLLAKAKLSLIYHFTEPILKEDGNLLIKGGRHPVLMLQKKVIPLDIEIGNGFTTLLITGPNMGGKTCALETVGFIVLMAMSGMHVPAEYAEIPFYENLFFDLIDESRFQHELSTFGMHLLNMNEALECASKKSLILIDEIGRGTDPIEGNALACAFLERFTEIGAHTICTTHQTPLKYFVKASKGMEAGAMEFKEGKPTYRLIIGEIGTSRAIEVAKSLKIDEKITKRAEEIMEKEELKASKLINKMEKEIQILKERIEKLEKELEEKKEGKIEKQEKAIKVEKAERKELKRKKKEERKSSLGILDTLKSVQKEVVKDKIDFEDEINLMGLHREEALKKLQKFIDDAIVAGLPEIRVIHGIGGGVLMQAVRDFLKKDDRVETFYTQGGITYVKFYED